MCWRGFVDNLVQQIFSCRLSAIVIIIKHDLHCECGDNYTLIYFF